MKSLALSALAVLILVLGVLATCMTLELLKDRTSELARLCAALLVLAMTLSAFRLTLYIRGHLNV